MERIITGHEAIAYADAHPSVTLQKYADPTEGARACHSVAEARDIAREDPSLIWLHLDAVTDEQIEALRDEALRAGDGAMADACNRALAGDDGGRFACQVAIDGCRAMDDSPKTETIHVTRVDGADVYGHNTKHCDESGCNGRELYFGEFPDTNRGDVIAVAS